MSKTSFNSNKNPKKDKVKDAQSTFLSKLYK